jgi:hypothetical protein
MKIEKPVNKHLHSRLNCINLNIIKVPKPLLGSFKILFQKVYKHAFWNSVWLCFLQINLFDGSGNCLKLWCGSYWYWIIFQQKFNEIEIEKKLEFGCPWCQWKALHNSNLIEFCCWKFKQIAKIGFGMKNQLSPDVFTLGPTALVYKIEESYIPHRNWMVGSELPISKSTNFRAMNCTYVESFS